MEHEMFTEQEKIDLNFYDCGWNDYIDGKPLPEAGKMRNYRDGWLDARLCQSRDKGQMPDKI